MNNYAPVQYVELVIKRSSRTYGTTPCTAAIGTTGTYKCYNSPRTCQDPANYSGTEYLVVRWAVPSADLDPQISADPRILSITKRPQMLDPGNSLGVRESVTIVMQNSLSDDLLFDKYIAGRPDKLYFRGTYFGKF